MEQVGLIAWNGKKLTPLVPMSQVEGELLGDHANCPPMKSPGYEATPRERG